MVYCIIFIIFYHISYVIDFSFEKYIRSTGHTKNNTNNNDAIHHLDLGSNQALAFELFHSAGTKIPCVL